MRGGVVLATLGLVGCGRLNFAPIGADARAGDDDDDGAEHGTEPPIVSCTGLPATCGPAGVGSCCDSPIVSGGTFYRGLDMAADMTYSAVTAPATVSSFRLDKYEVTVGRFRQFVMTGMGTQQNPPSAGVGARALNGLADQAGWDSAWNSDLVADEAALTAALKCDPTAASWTDTPGANELRPIDCVSWFDATAFCAWDGGFMPTEAEWNYAASGGDEQRAYPWSSPAGSVAIDCTMVNYGGANWPSTACVGVSSAVGRAPAGDGRWGQSDLAGNAWEWTLDEGSTDFYPTPCADCAYLVDLGARMVRGGAYDNPGPIERGGYRATLIPTYREAGLGFRCARAL
jgi:sulfatase modifying factor 1